MGQKITIGAGMVVYNPNKERLKECLKSIFSQFHQLIVFDNNGSCRELFADDERFVYLTENQNRGLAYALNKIMEKALLFGYDWLVTLDQDTLLPINLLESYQRYIYEDNVAVLSPQVIDSRRKYLKVENVNEDVTEVEFCITSASCTNLNIWKRLNGFDEWLFIDFIDNDYCKRVRLSGYKIMRLNKVVINQQFGDIELKSPRIVQFYLKLSEILHNKNIAKLSYKKKVNPLRVYYVHRNLLYLNKKFVKYGGIGYENFYCNSFLGFLICFTLPSLVRAQKFHSVLKAIFKGLIDGMKSVSIPFESIGDKQKSDNNQIAQ